MKMNEDETVDEVKERTLKINKVQIYESEIATIELLKQEGIYLSKIDLENDLSEVIAERMEEAFPNKEAIIFLQKKKLINMIELIKKLSDEDCKNIYNHELFMVLRRLVEQQ
ncbi:hypothetical protein ACE3MZ_13915 [Paenibacillus sp. WLX1005]|uniref:hypothetical protein n=1 Tax=Paenibacillus sp. WLX1005 TaxID=3243766 RepID=UPI0039842C47